MHSASSKLDMQVVELYEELMTNLIGEIYDSM